jgi:hypothetical protein
MLASDSNRKADGTPVRCRTDVTINLPIPVPTKDELDIIVKKAGPIAWLKMMEDVKNPDVDTDTTSIRDLIEVEKTTTFAEIENLLPRPPAVDDVPNLPNTNTELTEDDIKKLIENLKK